MFAPSLEPILVKVASDLGMQRDWLYNVVMMESSWNASAYNASGAVGLIQFMPQTLKSLGLLSPQLANDVPTYGVVQDPIKQRVKAEFLAKYPSPEAQLLGPVYKYFKSYAPFDTAQSVYMSVFYPKYRNAPPDTVFSAQIQAQNPGIDTVGAYVSRVERNAKTKTIVQKGAPLLALVGIGLTAYIMMK